MTEYDGMTITVEEYDERKDRTGRYAATVAGGPNNPRPQASGFLPSGSPASPMMARHPSSRVGGQASRWAIPPSPAPSHPSPPQMTRSGSLQAGDIDPRNLVVNSLDPIVDSKDLFNAFRRFGTIVSARVMKTSDGASRGFGFVSFTTEEATLTALREMNGAPLGISGQRMSIAHHVLRKPYQPAQASNGDASTDGSPRIVQQSAHEPVVSDALANLRLATPPTSTGTPVGLEAPIDLDVPTADPTVALTATSERDRLLTAVLGLPKPGDRLEDIVDLLTSLTNRERKLCLFNSHYLATKVAEAREVLEATDEPAAEVPHPPTPPTAVASLPTPAPTPARPSVAAVEPIYLTHDDLAKLPATEVLRLATASSPLVKPGLLSPVAPAQRDAVDAFVDSLSGQPEPQRKQKVGEKLFQVLKSQGIKKAVRRLALRALDRADALCRSLLLPSLLSIPRIFAPSLTSWSRTRRSSAPRPSNCRRSRIDGAPHRVLVCLST